MRVAVAGIGAISELHLRALKKEGQDIVALCDVIEERAVAAVKKYDLNAKVYTDYEKMLDCEKPQTVHVCTPHHLHAQMICAALNRGINVLCEKPLAISFGQLAQIEEAVKNSKAVLGVNHQKRFEEQIDFVKNYFEGKQIISAEGHQIWQRDAEYYLKDEWRGKKITEGGGVMINQALHTLDILQYVCGMPEYVTAVTDNLSLKEVIEVEDSAYGVFRLSDSRKFVVSATNAAKTSFPISFSFFDGKDCVEVVGDNVIVNGEFAMKGDGRPRFGKNEWGTGHAKLINKFYDCVRTGEKFPVDFYEARKVVRLVLKMYESAGREIPV